MPAPEIEVEIMQIDRGEYNSCHDDCSFLYINCYGDECCFLKDSNDNMVGLPVDKCPGAGKYKMTLERID